MIWSCLELKPSWSATPTSATRDVQNSISTILAPRPAKEKRKWAFTCNIKTRLSSTFAIASSTRLAVIHSIPSFGTNRNTTTVLIKVEKENLVWWVFHIAWEIHCVKVNSEKWKEIKEKGETLKGSVRVRICVKHTFCPEAPTQAHTRKHIMWLYYCCLCYLST